MCDEGGYSRAISLFSHSFYLASSDPAGAGFRWGRGQLKIYERGSKKVPHNSQIIHEDALSAHQGAISAAVRYSSAEYSARIYIHRGDVARIRREVLARTNEDLPSVARRDEGLNR